MEVCDIGNNTVYAVLKGFVTLDVLRTFNEEVKKAIVKTKAGKILSDSSEMQVMAKDAKEYNNNTLLVDWQNLGVKYNAVVLSKDVFGKWVARSLTQKHMDSSNTNRIMEARMFDNESVALSWIKSK